MRNLFLDFDLSELINYIQIYKIISFGEISSKESDLDLLIVSDDFEAMFSYKRNCFVKNLVRSNKKLDLICLTVSEYKNLKIKPSTFSLSILNKGEVIYER